MTFANGAAGSVGGECQIRSTSPEIESQLGYATTHSLHLRAIAARQTRQANRDPRLNLPVERIEPLLKRSASISFNE